MTRKRWLILGGMLLVGLFLFNRTRGNAAPNVFRWLSFVQEASTRFNIPASRIFGIIHTESSGSESATGSSGERGLMQLTRGALSDVNKRYTLGYTFDDMYDARKNILTGAAYIRILLDQLGNLDLATRAYNVGAGNVQKHPETSGLAYLSRVTENEKRYT